MDKIDLLKENQLLKDEKIAFLHKKLNKFKRQRTTMQDEHTELVHKNKILENKMDQN